MIVKRERESSFTKREFEEREREKGKERGSDGAIFSAFWVCLLTK